MHIMNRSINNSINALHFDPIKVPIIKKELDASCNFNLLIFDKLDSTNRYSKKIASDGAEEWSVVIAEEQTAGHGRFDRKFHSPQGCGIYMSIILRPKIKPEDCLRITTAAAVSVCKAIEALTVEQPSIKWVNDILINSKKVCGILTEASFNTKNNTLSYAVLGIGINAYVPENGFDKSIEDIAGAVFKRREPCMKEKLIASILNTFSSYYRDLNSDDIYNEYKQRLCVVGKDIDVINIDYTKRATVLSLNKDFSLNVQYENGERETISSGEISTHFV